MCEDFSRFVYHRQNLTSFSKHVRIKNDGRLTSVSTSHAGSLFTIIDGLLTFHCLLHNHEGHVCLTTFLSINVAILMWWIGVNSTELALYLPYVVLNLNSVTL